MNRKSAHLRVKLSNSPKAPYLRTGADQSFDPLGPGFWLVKSAKYQWVLKTDQKIGETNKKTIRNEFSYSFVFIFKFDFLFKLFILPLCSSFFHIWMCKIVKNNLDA